MKSLRSISLIAILCTILCSLFTSCDTVTQEPPKSSSGVTKATVKVATDLNGKTTEQNNIIGRYQVDNIPGSIKHLYIISTTTGDVLLYSTVKGKVTSSGKRLTPLSVLSTYGVNSYGFPVDIGGQQYYTSEVLQDDGTYGSSSEYIYWFDSKGLYHQQYIVAGAMIHVSNQPIGTKKAIINLEIIDK